MTTQTVAEATQALPATSLEVRLASRPDGRLAPDNFSFGQVSLNEPGDGEVVVRNEWMFLGSVYRDLMNATTSLPIPNYEVGQALWGTTVGTVVASKSDQLAVGDLVTHYFGWREYATGRPEYGFAKLDRDLFPGPEYYLCNGPTAWRGIVDMAEVGPDDVVFISGASGAVGSIAGQIAKIRGAKRVIGSTSSAAKIDYLVQELGYDAAFDTTGGDVEAKLRELAPDGISVFFDNIGGDQFEAAVQAAAPHARFALCGALSSQLGGAQDPKLDLMAIIAKQLVLRPFATLHTPEQMTVWNEHFARWLREDRIVFSRTVLEGGVQFAPEALIGVVERKYTGNVVLSLRG